MCVSVVEGQIHACASIGKPTRQTDMVAGATKSNRRHSRVKGAKGAKAAHGARGMKVALAEIGGSTGPILPKLRLIISIG